LRFAEKFLKKRGICGTTYYIQGMLFGNLKKSTLHDNYWVILGQNIDATKNMKNMLFSISKKLDFLVRDGICYDILFFPKMILHHKLQCY
jgi:hypothetical protein